MSRILISVTILLLLTACSYREPDLTGTWESQHIKLEITKNGDVYKVVTHRFDSNFPGIFTGKYLNGEIKFDESERIHLLCDRIKYSQDTDTIHYCGGEFNRVR